MGDFGEDLDNLLIRAFSGPGGTGTLPATAIGPLPAGGTTFTGFDAIAIYGQGGDDDMQVDIKIKKNVIMFGGNGNDRLAGGGGSNILDGGAGNDLLLIDKGASFSLLIGGSGIDTISDKGVGDIIIGDATDYDNPAVAGSEQALCLIRDTWRTGATKANYAARVTKVLNIISTKVHNDFSSEILPGSTGGLDVFFVGIGDKITGRQQGEKGFKSGSKTPA